MRVQELEKQIKELTCELNERKAALINLMLLTDTRTITVEDCKVTIMPASKAVANKENFGLDYIKLMESIDEAKKKICDANRELIRNKLSLIHQLETEIEELFNTEEVNSLVNQLVDCDLPALKSYKVSFKRINTPK